MNTPPSPFTYLPTSPLTYPLPPTHTHTHTHTHTGVDVIPTIIPRLPFGSNHLGISEDTTIALLCLLMELSTDDINNAR